MNRLPERCDLIVVGSGAAGLTAALVAAHQGLEVVVCEKMDRIGGTTAISGGTCWVPGNHLADPDDNGQDIEAARTYLEAEIGPDDEFGRRAAFLQTAREAFAFLANRTDVHFSLPLPYPDYHPDIPGASEGGRAIQPLPLDGRRLGDELARLAHPLFGLTVLGGMMVSRPEAKLLARPLASPEALAFSVKAIARHIRDRLQYERGTRLLLGNALVGRLVLSLRRFGVPIHTRAPMEGLVLHGGEVLGARLGGREVRAGKGVVLATGGFTSSPDWRNRLLPGEVTRALSAPGATGDGLSVALEAGGRVSAGHAASSFYMPASPLIREGKVELLFPHVIADRARPGVVAVDGSGRRFVNEGNSYHDFVSAMLACGQRVAYLICDRPSLRRYGLGLIRPIWQWLPYYIRRAYIVSAPTLAELAAELRIDPVALEGTISRYNKFCASGHDSDFGKGSNSLNLMYGDRSVTPNPCLGPIATPPYLAVPVIPAAIGASIGLETDADACVLGQDGKPIKGLFACGNDMASVMRGHYVGAGITLGPAITFAYRAAMKASTT